MFDQMIGNFTGCRARHEMTKENVVPLKNTLSDPIVRIMVLSDAYLPRAGGSREYYNNIYRRMANIEGCEVSILTKKVGGWKEFDREAQSDRFRIYRKYKPLNSWKYSELPKGIFPLAHALWHVFRNSPSIVHAGDLYPPGLIALLLKRILGLPYVVYCHGEEITQTDRFRHQPKFRNKIYQNADAVVANSEFARQNLLRIGVADQRIYKITPGVEAARFKPEPPSPVLVKRYGLQGKTVILTVARMIPRKGHKIALRAFAKVCREFESVHYLIVGTGPEESHLREFVKQEKLENRVTFAGHVDGRELPEIYNLCDIMLMPNRNESDGDVEGFGIVFLEANAAGKPVIGGRSGGAVEAIHDGVTGFLVNPDDAGEVAKALRHLLANQDLARSIGKNGRERVLADFSWETRSRFLHEINLDILGIKRTASEPSNMFLTELPPLAKKQIVPDVETPAKRMGENRVL